MSRTKNSRRTKAKPAGDEVVKWILKPGNYQGIGAIAGAHVRKEKAVEAQREAITQRRDRCLAQIEKLQSDIAATEEKIAMLETPDWTSGIVEPLVKELLRAFPGTVANTFPVGVSVAVSLRKEDATEQELESGAGMKSITFVPLGAGGKIGVRDYSRNLQKYPIGSPMDLQGENWATIPLADNTTVRELSEYLR